MRKKLFTVCLLAMALAILGAGTAAYFTAEATAHNVITSGGIHIAVNEYQDADGDDEWEAYPTKDPVSIMPGTVLSKIPVVNVVDGSAPAYIRAKATVTITDAAGNTITPANLADLVTINYNPNGGWVKKDPADGWFYYSTELSAGEYTTELFDTVTFDGPNMTNEYQSCTIAIDVSAQAVQTANNGETALAADGWPKN